AFLRGAGYIFSSPARWDGSDWLRFGAAGAGTAFVSGLDIDGRLFMQRHQSAGAGDLASAAMQYGGGVNLIALSAGGYIAGLAFHDRWIRETSFLAGSAILLSGTISTVTKIVVGRARPYMGRGHMTFRPFTFPVEHFASFPSGHTIVAFAFSGVLAERIKNTWASVGLYALAASTGISRMYADEHWISDVVFGAVISVSVSHSLVRWFESGGEPAGETGLRIIPGPQSLTFLWTF
ncbi:MAG TPA: phosphatase PAP2 family protein, partial [Bacteroidota bacterium]|nr:phosphatase PAP2 family protein [Bacteroidota bacterium]